MLDVVTGGGKVQANQANQMSVHKSTCWEVFESVVLAGSGEVDLASTQSSPSQILQGTGSVSVIVTHAVVPLAF